MQLLFTLDWSVIGWGVAALILLFILSLFGLRTRFGPTNQIDIFNIDDLMSGGLVGCLFGIIALPAIVIWAGISRLRNGPPPPKVPVVLPVEGDDPVWGRNVNRKVAENAFLKLPEALITCDPKIAKPYIDEFVYARLRKKCQSLRKDTIPTSAKDITEIIVKTEMIWETGSPTLPNAYMFGAEIRGTMADTGGETQGLAGATSQVFEEQ